MKDHAPDQDIGELCAHYGMRADCLIEILHEVQEARQHIPAWAMVEIAGHLNISRADVQGVVSFYDDFTEEADAIHVVKICRAEACQAVGARDMQALSSDRVTVKTVHCLGNCALGPAIEVDGKLVGRVDQQKLDAVVAGVSHD